MEELPNTRNLASSVNTSAFYRYESRKTQPTSVSPVDREESQRLSAGAAQEAKSDLPGVGQQGGLGYCYSQWGLLARQQGDKRTERQKLEQALAIFAELKMPRERDRIQGKLDKTDSASSS
jgi:hypothetical protein